MNMTMRAVLVGSVAMILGACGGGSKPATQEPTPAPASSDEALSNTQPAAAQPADASPNATAMAKMREFERAMCACKDSPCAQRVSDEMTKWAQQMSMNESEPPKMTEAEQQDAV